MKYNFSKQISFAKYLMLNFVFKTQPEQKSLFPQPLLVPPLE